MSGCGFGIGLFIHSYISYIVRGFGGCVLMMACLQTEVGASGFNFISSSNQGRQSHTITYCGINECVCACDGC